ncbi:uncharacterized protein LOC133801755 isoform X2 [Humulus lupulus]|uniref:uncharacterized protein LOC133801755 isoform X2 n=1 Tax=Humulus lupulus TaxID=3486 RepID=UPI002B40A976|nr:uncharacterized protein LOC133801755 isoform X2 [Humulus lupulus]
MLYYLKFWQTWLTYLVELLRGANTVAGMMLPPALCNSITKRNIWLICMRCQECLASQTLLIIVHCPFQFLHHLGILNLNMSSSFGTVYHAKWRGSVKARARLINRDWRALQGECT